ncbi:MAG: TolC family protein, partial [Terrimicrobiaceae bacterium]
MTRYFSTLAAILSTASLLIAQAPESAPAPAPNAPEIPSLPTPPPLPQFTPLPLTPPPVPATTPGAAPTPLPDGSMPLPLPPMPAAPPLPNAQQISSDLSAPLPPQQAEPLAPGPETQILKSSNREAMTKEMATTNFYKALDELIAKQRNPKVPDLTIQDAITTAIQKNPDILVAAQELNTTSGRFISIRSRIIPQVTVKSDYGYTTRDLNFVQDLGAQNINDEQWGVNIEFSQLIYDGGAVVSDIRAAISDEVESYYRLRGVIDRVIFEVKTNFYEVLLNRALIIANQQSVDLL